MATQSKLEAFKQRKDEIEQEIAALRKANTENDYYIQRSDQTKRLSTVLKPFSTHPVTSLFVVSCSIFLLYFFVSVPDSVVLQSNGQLSGMGNEIRAFLQGKSFWQDQLSKLDQRVADLKEMPKRRDEVERELTKISKEADEKVYHENPELRPTPAQRRADALRARADAIEDTEERKSFVKECSEKVDQLNMLMPIIEKKMKDMK